MKSAVQREPDRDEPGIWLARFSKACLRITSMLDLDSVLQEIIDSACTLTDARYGALLTFDESGDVRKLITYGITPEERRQVGDWPKGQGLLGHLSEIEGSLRLTDIAGHARSVGFPENHPPMKTFLGSPLRFRGELLGNIYITEKEGGREFSREDEDILVMFASQSAVAIANSRVLSAARQAGADMEAMVNVSPVGVVVFDAKTGDLLSANAETRRIVGKVKAPGRSIEQLLEVVALRRVDGSDIPIDELPIMKVIRNGESVLADEVVIHLPDGREITTLINARAVYGEDGSPKSVVATIQDITPLEDLKRQRAEFLGNVGHELRTPLTAIKGSVATILGSPHPIDPAEVRQFLRVIDEQADRMRNLINDLVDMTQIESGTLSVTPEPTDVESLLNQGRQAHNLEGSDDSIEVHLAAALPMVMADRRRILQVLGYLIADVSRYSPRSSTIRVSALPEDVCVAVSVDSECGGAPGSRPPEQLESLSRTSEEFAGKSKGMDGLGFAICEGIVEAHGGRISAERIAGRPSRFTFTIPAVDDAAHVAQQDSAQSPPARDIRGGQARILAIGETPETGRYIRDTLLQAGFIAVEAGDLDEAERLIEEHKPHVVLLEPALSWVEGFEMLARIGRITDAPVILVAGHGWNRQIGRAFELGAFDYIAKPFTSTELLARIDVAPRRRSVARWKEPSGPYRYGDLVIDYVDREVTVSVRPVHLTGDPVQTARRALRGGRACPDPRAAAEAGLGTASLRRLAGRAHMRKGAAPQAGRRCRPPHVHLHRTRGGLPHDKTVYGGWQLPKGDAVTDSASGVEGGPPKGLAVPSLHRTSTSARSPSGITSPSHRTNSMRCRPPPLRLLADLGACCRRALNLTSPASARRRGYMPAPERLELRCSGLKSNSRIWSPSTDAKAPAHCGPLTRPAAQNPAAVPRTELWPLSRPLPGSGHCGCLLSASATPPHKTLTQIARISSRHPHIEPEKCFF